MSYQCSFCSVSLTTFLVEFIKSKKTEFAVEVAMLKWRRKGRGGKRREEERRREERRKEDAYTCIKCLQREKDVQEQNRGN